jgi:hypothetical protein
MQFVAVVNRIRFLAFLFVAAALLSLSCHKKVSQGWFPLVLGSKWTYKLTSASDAGDFTITVTEVGEVKHYAKAVTDSGVALANVFPFNNLDGDTSCFYTVNGDTTWLGTSTGSAPLMVIVQPLDSVTAWRWTYVLWTDSAVVSGKTDVIVPAGTFKNCYEVDYYGFLGQLYYRVCYAKGIGAVKGEAFTSPTWRYELKSTDLP